MKPKRPNGDTFSISAVVTNAMLNAGVEKGAAIERELAKLAKRWDLFLASDTEGVGSSGEWMAERMGEPETEQRRRAAGGAIDTTVPLQSR